MGHYQKLYHKMKNNPKTVYFDDLEKLLTKVGGFISKSGLGDHYNFYHPDLDEIIGVDTRGKHRHLKSFYVKRALKAFEEICEWFKKEE